MFKPATKTMDRLQDIIPITEIYNNTVLTKNGYGIQIIEYTGENGFGHSSSQLQERSQLRNTIFKSLNVDYSYSFVNVINEDHSQKLPIEEKAPISNTLGGGNENKTGACHNLLYSESLPSRSSHKNLILVSRKIKLKNDDRDILSRFGLWAGVSDYDIKSFNNDTTKLISQLERYGAKLLSDNTNIKEILNSFINVKDTTVNGGKQDFSLDRILGQSNITINQDTLTLSNNNRATSVGIISVLNYPDNVVSGMFENINKLGIEVKIIQHVFPSSIREKVSNIADISHRLATRSFTRGRVNEAEEAGERAEQGNIGFHDYVCYMIVSANNKEDLESKLNKVRSTCDNYDVVTVREQNNMLYWCYLGIFPDYHADLIARMNTVSTENLSDFITLDGIPKGHTQCAFGEGSVAEFRTLSNTLYSFIFHDNEDQGALGHTLIIGASKSGKTTLTNYLLSNCLKYKDMKILSFDSMEGMYIPTLAMGGEYNNVLSGSDLKLNPFAQTGGKANTKFLRNIFRMLAGDLSDKEENIIDGLIELNQDMASDEISERNLGNLLELCKGTDLHRRLSHWISPNNPVSELFNSYEDSLSFKKQLVAFNIPEDILKDSNVLGILSYYIFYSFSRSVSRGSPHICFVDEMPFYLKNDIFADYISKAFKEWRKRNGVIIGAVQDASTLTSNDRGRQLINNSGKLIIFPNSVAKREEYCDGLGLTDTEYNWIKNFNQYSKYGQRCCLVKNRTTQESVVLDIDLSNMGQNLKLFSSQSSDVIKVKELQQQYGADWQRYYINSTTSEVANG